MLTQRLNPAPARPYPLRLQVYARKHTAPASYCLLTALRKLRNQKVKQYYVYKVVVDSARCSTRKGVLREKKCRKKIR